MKPYYNQNGITLYLGDCLSVLSQLEPESFDLVLTDPAYESLNRWQGIGTTARMGMGKTGSGSDNLEEKWFETFPNDNLPDLIQSCHALLKNERHAYFFSDWETIKLLHQFAIAEGVFAPVGYGGIFEPCKPIIWRDAQTPQEARKALLNTVAEWLDGFSDGVIDYADERSEPNSKMLWDDMLESAADLLSLIGKLTDDSDSTALVWNKVISGLGYTYRATYEFILMLWKGKKRKLNDLAIPDILDFKKPWGKERLYPTQKPVALCELLINQSTQPGELIVDPFIGGGTTALAALHTERRCVGIDKSERALQTTIARLEGREVEQPKKEPKQPKAKKEPVITSEPQAQFPAFI